MTTMRNLGKSINPNKINRIQTKSIKSKQNQSSPNGIRGRGADRYFFCHFDVILGHVLAVKSHISIQNMIWDHPHGGKTHEESFVDPLRPPKHRFRWVFHSFMKSVWLFDIFSKKKKHFSQKANVTPTFLLKFRDASF